MSCAGARNPSMAVTWKSDAGWVVMAVLLLQLQLQLQPGAAQATETKWMHKRELLRRHQQVGSSGHGPLQHAEQVVPAAEQVTCTSGAHVSPAQLACGDTPLLSLPGVIRHVFALVHVRRLPVSPAQPRQRLLPWRQLHTAAPRVPPQGLQGHAQRGVVPRALQHRLHVSGAAAQGQAQVAKHCYVTGFAVDAVQLL